MVNYLWINHCLIKKYNSTQNRIKNIRYQIKSTWNHIECCPPLMSSYSKAYRVEVNDKRLFSIACQISGHFILSTEVTKFVTKWKA